jgi:anti-anti-sigma factor
VAFLGDTPVEDGERFRDERLSVSVSIEHEHVVVALSGEMDMANALSVPEIVAACVHADRPVLIDLQDVTFLDSSGLRAILVSKARLEAENVTLQVTNASTRVRRVFEITRLTHLLESRSGRDESELIADQ